MRTRTEGRPCDMLTAPPSQRRPQEKPALLTCLDLGTSRLWDFEKTHFCYLSHTICGALLWQPNTSTFPEWPRGRALRNLGPGRNRKIYQGEGSTNFSLPRPLPELHPPLGFPSDSPFHQAHTLLSPSPETCSVWKAHLQLTKGYPILLHALKEAAESVLSCCRTDPPRH